MAEAVGFSNLQDDLNASGYAGLINLILVSDGTYEGSGSPNSGVKVPYLYPSDDGRTKLSSEMGTTMSFARAVILDKNGNRVENLLIYPGYTYTLTSATDYATIRSKLINAAHASGLYPPTAKVMLPNGGEFLAVGSAENIRWSEAGIGGNVKIELFKGGVFHSTITASTPNTGSFTWDIPSNHEQATDFKVKITPALAPEKADESDNNFSIDNPVYVANMDSDPGWTLVGEWGYGAPAGMTETCYQPPTPPTSAHTGTKVIGYDLNGAYATGMPGTDWATTPAFDCSQRSGVTLTFWRYLGVYNGDKAYVQVKNGSGSWQTVYESTTWENTASWGFFSYDISSMADGQSGVQIRFGIGPTTSIYPFCGLYIDDLRVLGTYIPPITTNGTPYAWLAAHGFTNNQEDVDLLDSDGDGAYNWQEYLAGTDPTNEFSTFRVLAMHYLGVSNRVSWYGTTNSGVLADFIILRATNLVTPGWLPVGTSSRSSSGTNVWWDSDPPQQGHGLFI